MYHEIETEWGRETRPFCDECGVEIGDSEGVFLASGGEFCDSGAEYLEIEE